MKLTRKQQCFVDEYLIDLNATQAAIRAGYSKASAKEIGCQLLTKLNISTVIAAALEARNEKLSVDAEWVLKEAIATYEEAREGRDLRTALTALALIGKHVDVQSFKDRVEVTQVDHAAILEARIANVERLRPKAH